MSIRLKGNSMTLKTYGVISGHEIDLRLKDDSTEDLWDRWSPEYRFNVLLHSTDTIIGYINVRIGEDEGLKYYYGHIGYGIDKKYRGHKYAVKACELAKTVLQDKDVKKVIMTCDPRNMASRKTCERLGGVLIDMIDIPVDSEAYSTNQTQKCRVEWTI